MTLPTRVKIVDVGPRDEFGDTRRDERHRVFRRKGAAVFRIARRNAHQPPALRRRDRLRMVVGNHTDADDAETEGGAR